MVLEKKVIRETEVTVNVLGRDENGVRKKVETQER